MSASVFLPVPKWLVNRVSLWLKRTKLDAQWSVTVEMTERATYQGQPCQAFTRWAPGYTSAFIQFARVTYDEMTPAQVDRLICHELYHLVHAREDDRLTEDVGSGKVYDNYVREAEHCAEFFGTLLTRAYGRRKE